jgi:hypothetical protein
MGLEFGVSCLGVAGLSRELLRVECNSMAADTLAYLPRLV